MEEFILNLLCKYLAWMVHIKTHDTIFNFLELVKVLKQANKICQKLYPMVSSILHIMSQNEHTKEQNNIDSKRKSMKQNIDHQNRLTVCFYMLL